MITRIRNISDTQVAPRMGRVSRNYLTKKKLLWDKVAPRMGRVSRNDYDMIILDEISGRAPHGACE